MSELLTVSDVSVQFKSASGFTARPATTMALDGVSLHVEAGEILALVGESGCGKTTLARAILGLQPLSAGTITLDGERVEGVRKHNATKIGMVWQDPFASLNPRWPVRRSVMEPLELAGKSGSVSEVLEEVGLGATYLNRYPHELSGGQRQRVAIGRALALRPPLIICDEPTAALDLSVRAQILNLLKELKTAHDSAFLYISHDLTTVRFLADRVAVMYMGRIVEIGRADSVFRNPMHPYTAALLASAPSLDRLLQLPEAPAGEIPDPRTKFVGCRFAGRCPRADALCIRSDPGPSRHEDQTYFCHHPLSAP